MSVRELLALIMSLVTATATAVAQDPVAVASAGNMTIEDLRVTVNKSLVIDYPADISRISTSNPEVVDAVPATSREFLLHGKGHGSATVVVWAKNGLRTMYNVTVEHNLDPIKRLLKDTFPNENIGLVAGRDSITLIGTVSSKDVADRALAIATPLAKAVVSNLALTTAPVAKQIILKVRFAELDRTVSQQFGVNFLSTGADHTLGTLGTQQFSPPQLSNDGKFTISDALNIFAFRRDLNLGALVKALQAQGVLQILAEPNLVTTNGKEASFLVGGEFPVPVLQGGGNAGAVTIQFREFGIRLLFKPELTENNTIKLYVKPEVSTIDLANAVTFSGFTIPALATRRMETNIELGAGQSFVIAGLIDDRVTESFNKLPGLANIPILGTLFRSRSQNRSKSELVIIVTPEVVTPLNASDAKPEPAWLKEFLPQKAPGEKVGTDLVPGTGGATVPPIAPGKFQVNRDSFGNGDHSRSSTPAAPHQGGAKPKASVKGDADSGKRGKLKFWSHKPDATAGAANPAGVGTGTVPAAFQVTPVGERPLTPPVGSSVTVPIQAPIQFGGQAPASSAGIVQSEISTPPVVPLPVSTVNALPLPEAAAPLAVVPETKATDPRATDPRATETKETEPGATEPKASEPKAAPVTATPASPIEAEPKAVGGQPGSQPVEAKSVADGQAARATNGATSVARRTLSAGITSLPPQVLSVPAAGQAGSGPRSSSIPGEQH